MQSSFKVTSAKLTGNWDAINLYKH